MAFLATVSPVTVAMSLDAAASRLSLLSGVTFSAVEYTRALAAWVLAKDSDISLWIWPNSHRYSPNARRSETAYLVMTSQHRRAMPMDCAASVRRSISRLRIMWTIAPPSLPRRFDAGMIMFSNTMLPVGDARIPSLDSAGPEENPGEVRSTTNALMLRGESPVFA